MRDVNSTSSGAPPSTGPPDIFGVKTFATGRAIRGIIFDFIDKAPGALTVEHVQRSVRPRLRVTHFRITHLGDDTWHPNVRAYLDVDALCLYRRRGVRFG